MQYHDFCYDVETFPNVFTCDFKCTRTNKHYMFEISDYVNQAVELEQFITGLANQINARLVGFNNIGFDYPILHLFYSCSRTPDIHRILYDKCQQIIEDGKNPQGRFRHIIWDNEHIIPQIDLYKIHHFDNRARTTSLKMMEFNLEMDRIDDLPYKPGTPLTAPQIVELKEYNKHDVDATHLFYNESQTEIKFREELCQTYGGNKWLNYSDKKIGSEIYISKMEEVAPGSCFTRENNRKVKRQTIRDSVKLSEVILPYVQFNNAEFNRILNYFKATTVDGYDPDIGKLTATVGGLDFVFGVGGLHGSIESSTIESNDEEMIIDLDVTSYYPSLGMVNNLYPEHLSTAFCDVARFIKSERAKYDKGTSTNLAYKLSMNGAYGDTNNKYSPFMDVKYMLSITINGQLLLCMLSEAMMQIPGLKMIQANTDGITFKCPRNQYHNVQAMREWWQNLTRLDLEEEQYNRMFIRDVNNYIGEYINGKVKRKGAYEYDINWHQDFSQRIVAKAAEEHLLRGTPIEQYIKNHKNMMDFMLKAKVNRTDKLLMSEPVPLYWNKQLKIYSTRPSVLKLDGWEPTEGGLKSHPERAAKQGIFPYKDTEIERISRFYVANNGPQLFKTMPPLARAKHKIRRISINKGQQVRVCNKITDAEPWDINYDYYITETEKLVNPVLSR